jgi:hypothetical protein
MENDFMDNTSFDLLCKGLSSDEAKLFRKILKEWCSGDEDSFPVQLALLTKSQWNAVAQMLIMLQKYSEMFEKKFDQHQKQLAALVKSSENIGDDKIKAFEETVAVHAEAMQKITAKSHNHMDETEAFARSIRKQMELGLRESERITKAFFDEKAQLLTARHDYEQSIKWRETGLQLFAFIIATFIGFIIGWYNFAHPH